MKKNLFIFVFLMSSNLFAQFVEFESYEFEGFFAFTNDKRLVSIDDMIFRESFFYQLNSCDKIIKNNIFIMDYFFKGIDYTLKDNSLKVNGMINDEEFIINNNEKYSFFSNSKTRAQKFKKFDFKVFKLKFKAIYLGDLNQKIRVKNKFKNKFIHTFFIYEFKNIETL